MKLLCYLLIGFSFLSCSQPETGNKTHSSNTIPSLEALEVEEVVDTTKDIKDCFLGIDTSSVDYAVGCVRSFYKTIGRDYVLQINVKESNGHGRCISYQLDSLQKSCTAVLHVFEKGKASLTNLCTDLIVTNFPKPIRLLDQCTGRLTVGEIYPANPDRNRMTIHIDQLTFTDSQTTKQIVVENELYWKVLNLGTPG